ncbi:unnamed protein product, partial [Discosporangium mesarthrocarpum]
TRVVIVGGGPSGALTSLYLAHPSRGFDIDILEGMPKEDVGRRTSRSYNVVVFERGLEALKAGGVDLNEQAGNALILTGNVRHTTEGGVMKVGGLFTGTTSIGRGALARMLLEKASQLPNVRVHYGHKLQDVDLEARCGHGVVA